MNFFPVALAESAHQTNAVDQGGFSSIIMLFGFIVIFYFLIWRPQNKRAKDHRNLLSSLAKDDEIITSGGLLGKIVSIKDNYVIVSVAEGINITIQKSSVTQVLPKGTLKTI